MRTFVCFIFIFFLNLTLLQAKEQTGVIKTGYLNQMFGHIHQNPSRYSQSMSTVACGHPLKVMKLVQEDGTEKVIFSKEWNRVSTGPYEGYIQERYISDKKPSCFQDRFPKFFQAINLELTEMYYWGRLYDHYDWGHSKAGR